MPVPTESFQETLLDKKKLAEDPFTCLWEISRDWSDPILLAIFDDGVAWGKANKHGFDFADRSTWPKLPEIRKETLREARVFAKEGEAHAWRVGRDLRATCLTDSGLSEERFKSENYILHGYRMGKSHLGWTEVSEGTGHRHVVPLAMEPEAFGPEKRPLSLLVRHYIAFDDDGAAYVAASRLVALEGGT